MKEKAIKLNQNDSKNQTGNIIKIFVVEKRRIKMWEHKVSCKLTVTGYTRELTRELLC